MSGILCDKHGRVKGSFLGEQVCFDRAPCLKCVMGKFFRGVNISQCKPFAFCIAITVLLNMSVLKKLRIFLMILKNQVIYNYCSYLPSN